MFGFGKAKNNAGPHPHSFSDLSNKKMRPQINLSTDSSCPLRCTLCAIESKGPPHVIIGAPSTQAHGTTDPESTRKRKIQ